MWRGRWCEGKKDEETVEEKEAEVVKTAVSLVVRSGSSARLRYLRLAEVVMVELVVLDVPRLDQHPVQPVSAPAVAARPTSGRPA